MCIKYVVCLCVTFVSVVPQLRTCRHVALRVLLVAFAYSCRWHHFARRHGGEVRAGVADTSAKMRHSSALQ